MDVIHPLKAFRQRQTPQLSPAALARMLGVSRSYVLRLENGERRPGLELLPLIEEKTGIAPAELRPDISKFLKVAPEQEAAE